MRSATCAVLCYVRHVYRFDHRSLCSKRKGHALKDVLDAVDGDADLDVGVRVVLRREEQVVRHHPAVVELLAPAHDTLLVGHRLTAQESQCQGQCCITLVRQWCLARLKCECSGEGQ